MRLGFLHRTTQMFLYLKHRHLMCTLHMPACCCPINLIYRSHKEEQASSAKSAPSSTAAVAAALMFNCTLLIVGSLFYVFILFFLIYCFSDQCNSSNYYLFTLFMICIRMYKVLSQFYTGQCPKQSSAVI